MALRETSTVTSADTLRVAARCAASLRQDLHDPSYCVTEHARATGARDEL